MELVRRGGSPSLSFGERAGVRGNRLYSANTSLEPSNHVGSSAKPWSFEQDNYGPTRIR